MRSSREVDDIILIQRMTVEMLVFEDDVMI